MISCNTETALRNRKKFFDHLYVKEKVEIKGKDGVVFERWHVYTSYPKKDKELKCLLLGKDPEDLEDFVSSDDGRGFLKHILTNVT